MAGLIVDKAGMPVIPAVAGFMPHFNEAANLAVRRKIFKGS